MTILQEFIKHELLKGNTTEHDALKSICESHEWNPDDEDLMQNFKADYNAVIESDWWEKVQREQRMNEYLEEHDRTDEREHNLEKSRMVNKYS